MKHRMCFFVLLAVCCIPRPPVWGQQPSAYDYFPMQVGNVWEYDDVTQNRLDRYEVVSDTLIADSILVYKMIHQYKREQDASWTEFKTNYYYYNSDSSIIYESDDFPTSPYHFSSDDSPHFFTKRMLLRSDLGIAGKWYVAYDYLASFAIFDTNSISLFDSIWNYADVHEFKDNPDTLISDGLSNRYAVSLGPINIQDIWKLTYAKINGIEYGTPIMTSIKDTHVKFSKSSKIQVSSSPNPMNNYGTITIKNPTSSLVQVKIVNILGQTLRKYEFQSRQNISHKIFWNGKDDNNILQPSGIYFVIVQTDKLKSSLQITLIQ